MTNTPQLTNKMEAPIFDPKTGQKFEHQYFEINKGLQLSNSQILHRLILVLVN